MEENEGHSSDFLARLQVLGFRTQFAVCFSEEEQSEFYSVLAAALTLHRSQSYPEFSPYLAHLWAERLPSFSKVAHSQDLAVLGSALLSDITQQFQNAPWVSLLHKGKIPNKACAKIWTTLADYCAFQLIWYEATSTGIITHRYASGNAESWSVILTLAEERPRLYLVVHVDFWGAPRVGFPFYASARESVKVPILGVENDTDDHLEEKAQRALARWQADIINTLLQLLSQVPVLPADTTPLQDQIRVLYQRLQSLPNSINIAAIQAFLGLADTAEQHPQHECIFCREIFSSSAFYQLEHGHAICYGCCFSKKSISACPCGVPLSLQDQKKKQLYATMSVRKAT